MITSYLISNILHRELPLGTLSTGEINRLADAVYAEVSTSHAGVLPMSPAGKCNGLSAPAPNKQEPQAASDLIEAVRGLYRERKYCSENAVLDKVIALIRQREAHHPAAPTSGVDENIALDIALLLEERLFPIIRLHDPANGKFSWGRHEVITVIKEAIRPYLRTHQPDLATLLAKPETLEAVARAMEPMTFMVLDQVESGEYRAAPGYETIPRKAAECRKYAQAVISTIRKLAGIPQPAEGGKAKP